MRWARVRPLPQRAHRVHGRLGREPDALQQRVRGRHVRGQVDPRRPRHEDARRRRRAGGGAAVAGQAPVHRPHEVRGVEGAEDGEGGLEGGARGERARQVPVRLGLGERPGGPGHLLADHRPLRQGPGGEHRRRVHLRQGRPRAGGARRLGLHRRLRRQGALRAQGRPGPGRAGGHVPGQGGRAVLRVPRGRGRRPGRPGGGDARGERGEVREGRLVRGRHLREAREGLGAAPLPGARGARRARRQGLQREAAPADQRADRPPDDAHHRHGHALGREVQGGPPAVRRRRGAPREGVRGSLQAPHRARVSLVQRQGPEGFGKRCMPSREVRLFR
mmetsp:Transcript_51066/g.143754  ORF Transcript_51066/g.143754 Transcript_51066/m.143754 type:complete len:333 (+) Transcript_51066:577-1575(+)